MSEATEEKSAPPSETPASTEPGIAETETKLATNPADHEAETSSATDGKQSYSDMASNAAGSATAAAVGVKDSVFSMFGGGGVKEKKVEQPHDNEQDERSGSAKATKEKEAEEEVGSQALFFVLCIVSHLSTAQPLLTHSC